MKKIFLPALAITALAASCTSSNETNTTVNNDTTMVAPGTNTTVTTTRTIITPLDESAKYIDLRSGRQIALRKNDMGIYSSDMGDLDLYYNPATNDTFYMGEAYPVNGHLMRQGTDYTVDRSWFETTYPTAYNTGSTATASGSLPVTGEAEKMRVEADGDMKMKNDDGTIKEKYKQDGEGDDMKYKVKNKETGEKVKVTEDQIKIKDASGTKTVVERDGDVKVK